MPMPNEIVGRLMPVPSCNLENRPGSNRRDKIHGLPPPSCPSCTAVPVELPFVRIMSSFLAKWVPIFI